MTDKPVTTGFRWPHILWSGDATMVFPTVKRDVTHYGIVWGPWFLGIVRGGKQHD
jgi:hypothetical protein